MKHFVPCFVIPCYQQIHLLLRFPQFDLDITVKCRPMKRTHAKGITRVECKNLFKHYNT